MIGRTRRSADPLRVPSQNLEVNDTVRWRNVTVNLGLLASNDTLYGQGLREDGSATLTGFRAEVGTKYEMYDLPFSKMLQPRPAPPGPSTAATRSTAAMPATTRRPAHCRARRRGTATSR